MILLLAACSAVACSASTSSRANERPNNPPTADSVRRGHADVDLTGTWAVGSTGEPTARRIVIRPECNYTPSIWALQQSGDTVRLWTIPASRAKGVAETHSVSTTPAEGWVSGVDLRIRTAGASYELRYDSTSSHLRGTLNGAPFWAVREDIVRPEQCIPPP